MLMEIDTMLITYILDKLFYSKLMAYLANPLPEELTREESQFLEKLNDSEVTRKVTGRGRLQRATKQEMMEDE